MEFIVCFKRRYHRGAYLHQWLLTKQIGDMDDQRYCEEQLIRVNKWNSPRRSNPADQHHENVFCNTVTADCPDLTMQDQ